MVQQLKAPAALPKDLDSSPSTRRVAPNPLELQSQGLQCPLLASTGTACKWYIDMHLGKTPTHMKINNTKFKSNIAISSKKS